MPLSLLVKVKNSRPGDIFAFDTCVLVGSGIGVLVGSALACGGVVGTSWVHAGIMKRHTIVADISFNTIA